MKTKTMCHKPYESTLFITGMIRSGTTLLANLINSKSPNKILYQPFMPLFTGIKNVFFNSLGYDSERYPLGTLFFEERYDPNQFLAFLESYNLKDFPGLNDVIGIENNYSGCLAEILPQILLNAKFAKENPVIGFKEVLCEEYCLYLAKHGFKVFIVLRDPRDIITSMNYGLGNQFTGKIRPTLYNLRIWRKSVAFALHLHNLGLARFIRYEDIVFDTDAQINTIQSWSGIANIGYKANSKINLLNEKGEKWHGNSSFGKQEGISKTSVGRFKNLLPDKLITYIETVCGPEMLYLGYKKTSSNPSHNKFEEILSSFQEPFAINHPAVSSGYSTYDKNIYQEKQRLELMNRKNYHLDSKTRLYFLFDDVFEKLYHFYNKKTE